MSSKEGILWYKESSVFNEYNTMTTLMTKRAETTKRKNAHSEGSADSDAGAPPVGK